MASHSRRIGRNIARMKPALTNLPTIEPSREGKLSLGPVLREVLRSEQLLHPRSQLRFAAWLMIAQPIALALVMLLLRDSLIEVLLVGEVVLTGGLGFSLLRRGRESARKHAFLLVLLNTVFLTVFCYLIGNMILQMMQLCWFFGLAWLLHGRYPRKASRRIGGALCYAGFMLALAFGGWGRWQMDQAESAWRGDDREQALNELDQAAFFLDVVGASQADRAVIAFCRARTALEAGEAARVNELVAQADLRSRSLPGPPLCAAEVYGRDASLGYALKNRAVVELYSRSYALRAWGETPSLEKNQLLGEYRLYASDGVIWTLGLLDPVGDGVTPVPACGNAD